MASFGVTRRRVLAGAGSGLLLSGGARAAGELTIGVLLPLSGTYANQGVQYGNGIKTFQAMHGTTVAGIPVKLVIRDDQGPASGDLSRRLTQELIVREKANVILGYCFTPNAMSSASLLSEAKVPGVIINAATSVITERSPYFVRVSFTLPQVASVLGRYAAEHGIKTAYSIVSDYGPGLDAETWFKKGFEDAGGRLIGSARTPVSEMEYSPFLQRAIEAKPDAVFSFDPGGDVAIAFMKQASKRLEGTGIKLLVTGDLVEDDNMPLFGIAAKDVLSAQIYQVGLDNPANKAFLAQYHELFGADAIPNMRSVSAYDGMGLIYQAVTATKGDLSSAALLAAMKGAVLDSPRGKFFVDPATREAVETVYVRTGQQVDGQWQNVEIAAYPETKDPAKGAPPK